jgi:hypothetical protein
MEEQDMTSSNSGESSKEEKLNLTQEQQEKLVMQLMEQKELLNQMMNLQEMRTEEVYKVTLIQELKKITKELNSISQMLYDLNKIVMEKK